MAYIEHMSFGQDTMALVNMGIYQNKNNKFSYSLTTSHLV